MSGRSRVTQRLGAALPRNPLGTAAAILVLSLTATWPQDMAAQSSQDESLVRETSDFWLDVTQPGYRRSRTLLRHALGLLGEAGQPVLGDALRRAHYEGAIQRLEMAHHLAPRDPEVLFLLAYATSRWERRDGSDRVHRLDDQAAQRLHRLRALDPGYEAEVVAFELGVLHTRAHRFEQAAVEYEVSIRHALVPETTATTHANLAEVTMLAGDPQQAVEHYEQAIELARRAGGSGELSLWGLSVALDRLGEHRSAVERTTDALNASGGSMAVLRMDGVFFEPPHEVHWYEGLGHEAQAAQSLTNEPRESHLRQAVRSYRRYLAAEQDHEGWVELARERVEQLEAEIADRTLRSRRRVTGPRP